MVLKIEGKLVDNIPPTVEDFIDSCLSAELRSQSSEFGSRPVVQVSPQERCLYVGQREMVGVTQEDPNIQMIGSEDATTCHLVFLCGGGAAGVVHLDSCDEEGLVRLLEKLGSLRNPTSVTSNSDVSEFDAYLVGGYNDERGMAETITLFILDYMSNQDAAVFNLKLFCSSHINTEVKGGVAWPRVYGAAYSLSTGQIFPAEFSNRGPDTDIRSLRMQSDLSEVMSLYDNCTGRMVLPPFTYQTFQNADLWLTLPDDLLLSRCSTSPKVEPPHFCNQMRDTFRRMLTDPHPRQSLFIGNEPRCYSRDPVTGEWQLERPELYTTTTRRRKEGGERRTQLSVKDFINSFR